MSWKIYGSMGKFKIKYDFCWTQRNCHCYNIESEMKACICDTFSKIKFPSRTIQN